MLKNAKIRNFTLFKEESFDFGKNLNVYIGENGLGKSHLLKLPYASLYPLYKESKKKPSSVPTKVYLQTAIAQKLINVYRPDSLGRLSKRKEGRDKTEISFGFFSKEDTDAAEISYTFAPNSKSEVELLKIPKKWMDSPMVFIPTRELLSIYPGFVSLYENYHLEFEETWRDTCILLGAPTAKRIKPGYTDKLLKPIEKALGGEVVLDAAGKFYLSLPKTGNIEITLVAEGLRRLAMISRIVSTGLFMKGGMLFWDEPEANLNPKLVKLVASAIIGLASGGVQVHIATHSLFLMRELEIQLRDKEYQKLDVRFFGIQKQDEKIEVIQGASFDDLSHITSLEEELSQSDRYMGI